MRVARRAAASFSPRQYEGSLDAEGLRVGVVCARWNPTVTDAMLTAALDTLRRRGARAADVSVARVPGAFEVAAGAKALIDSGRFELSETGMDIPPGTVVGELGMLSPDGRRTQSLVCRETGDVQSLSYDRFEELYFQNPEFGLSFLKLTSRRLFQNIARLEQELGARNAPSGVPAG